MTRSLLLLAENTRNIGDLALRRHLYTWLGDHGLTDVVQAEWASSHQLLDVIPEFFGELKSFKRSPIEVLRAAIGGRLVIGPGQMVRDNLSVVSLFSMAVLATAARITGGEVSFLGVSVGRLERPVHRLLWRYIARLSKAGWFRDTVSLARASSELGMGEKSFLTADLLFLNGPVRAALEEPGPEDVLLFAPCRDLGERRVASVDVIAQLAAELTRKTGASKVVLVAHDVREDGDYRHVEVCREAIEALAPQIHCTTVRSTDLDVVAAHYRNARLVVTNRLHAMIFGFLARRPVMVIDDGSTKLDIYAEMFGLPMVGSIEDLAAHVCPEIVATDRYAEVLARLGEAAERGMRDCLTPSAR